MRNGTGRRLRALAVNLLVSAASAVVMLGGLELLLRVTSLAPSQALRSADISTMERIPGLYLPGQEFVDRVRPELPSEIRINSLGFRGREISEARSPRSLRILALGDSYTFGDHVDTGQTWPARLEGALSARPAAGEVEVVNAGVNGFGILDETGLWLKAGTRMDPDIVVVAFSPNDISDMTRPVPMIEQMRRHAEMKGRPLLGPLVRVAQRTALFNGIQILAARIRVATRSHDAIPEIEPARAGPEAAPEAWKAYRAALRDLGRILAAAGRRSLLVHYPSHGIVAGDDPPHAAEVLPAWAAESGMEYLDLLPAFRRAATAGTLLYLVPRDSHPSPEGHAVAAEAIARAMERLGWVPPAEGGPEPGA